MARERYMRQVDLLVRTLPFIARHEAFALKGGTAINLFYRDMPRLSVDIDLTYLPIEDRETTLKNIDTILDHIREDLLRNLRNTSVQRIAGGGNNDSLGFSVLRDSQAAGEAEPAGTWRWGGAYGHSWFIDPSNRVTVVALTNTAFEGMSGAGRFSADLSRAIYAAMAEPS